MITIKDILNMVWNDNCCRYSNRVIHNSCVDCHMYKYCGVDTKIITIDYLNRGEYYG